jgi:small redox-active disulfide protein 2
MGVDREYLATQHEAGKPEDKERTVKIEILGPGCARCRATGENVRKALAELQREAEVEHITDPREIGRRGVLLTPGVIMEGKVMCSGRVPEVSEIKKWLGGA